MTLNNAKINKSQIFNYSLFAFPLSFVGLPIYINISDFYAKKFGLELALIGLILMVVRIIDVLQDIAVGYVSDFLARKKFYRQRIISISAICLCFLFYVLFNPPNISGNFLITIWFFAILTLTYTFFNFAVINYEAIAALVAKNQSQRIAINSAKEFVGLLGFLVATILPFALMQINNNSLEDGYFSLSLFFVMSILVANFFGLSKVKIDHSYQKNMAKKINLKAVFFQKDFLIFLIIFLVNSIAVSLPTATIIFYVEDVLDLKDKFGSFLGVYFVSAIVFMFFWKGILQKYDKIKIWIISIIGSVLTFFLAFFLDANNAQYFYLICFFSGIFLGPDLINPPSIIADLTQKNKNEISSFFALYNMTSKIGLMLASSISLLILGIYGYQPGEKSNVGQEIIPYLYAFVPCILKLIVVGLLIVKSYARKNYQQYHKGFV